MQNIVGIARLIKKDPICPAQRYRPDMSDGHIMWQFPEVESSNGKLGPSPKAFRTENAYVPEVGRSIDAVVVLGVKLVPDSAL